MACVTFNGSITNDCSNNIGGITKLYLTDRNNVTSYTQTGGTVSAIVLAGVTASYGFYKFDFNRNSATFTEDLQKNVEAGSALFEQTIVVTIPKRDVAKRNVLQLLTQRDLACIIKDSNGIYWYIGAEEGVYLLTQTSTSGTAKADGSNYVPTLKGFEVAQAYAVDPTIIAGLLATA